MNEYQAWRAYSASFRGMGRQEVGSQNVKVLGKHIEEITVSSCPSPKPVPVPLNVFDTKREKRLRLKFTDNVFQ